MNQFDINKRRVWSFNEFRKDADRLEKAKHVDKGESEITKKSMPGEEAPKSDAAIATLEKPKKEEGTHKVVDMTHSGPDNGKGGRAILDKPVTESENAEEINEDLAAMWDSFQSLFTDPTVVSVAGEAITKGALMTSLAATLLGLPIVGVGLSKLQDWWKGADKEDSKNIIKAIKDAKKGAELEKFIKPKKV